jgi:hypothetical protein
MSVDVDGWMSYAMTKEEVDRLNRVAEHIHLLIKRE